MLSLYERYGKRLYWLLGFALLALSARSAFAIAGHGVAGWLRGDAGFQTEWEVRATILAATILLSVLIAILWHAGDLTVSRWRDWRLVRSIRRERRERNPGRS